MPYSQGSSPTTVKEASESRDLLQIDDTTNPGWNDYLDWDLEGLAYQPKAVTWSSRDRTIFDQPTYYTDHGLGTTETANVPLDTSSAKDVCGLQQSFSSATQDSSWVPPSATTPFIVGESYEGFTLIDNCGRESQSPHQTHGTQPWSSKLEDNGHLRRASDSKTNETIEELEDPPNSSIEEHERISPDISGANERRKIAHKVIEKNYRSRIQDGMAELRHCVPSTINGRSPGELDRLQGQSAKKILPKHFSGKVATLSDAVQYVKTLELQNTALHGQLDNIQRRNSTLQKIALSKVNMYTFATTVASEEADQEDSDLYVSDTNLSRPPKRNQKSPPDHVHSGSNTGIARRCGDFHVRRSRIRQILSKGG